MGLKFEFYNNKNVKYLRLICEWCRLNTESKWAYKVKNGKTVFRFWSASDAILFRLRWI